ncbi:hypothetical protein DJ71_27290 [Halorubrum sp. E3]|nr:hypothetical protein DJ71_27290 [Halorubrum sp. E3]
MIDGFLNLLLLEILIVVLAGEHRGQISVLESVHECCCGGGEAQEASLGCSVIDCDCVSIRHGVLERGCRIRYQFFLSTLELLLGFRSRDISILKLCLKLFLKAAERFLIPLDLYGQCCFSLGCCALVTISCCSLVTLSL